jgi:hypothetical protein
MKPLLNSITIWSGVLIILMALTGAISFAFTNVMEDKLYGNKRTGFIVMLIVYSGYRSFRVYQTLKQQKRDEE